VLILLEVLSHEESSSNVFRILVIVLSFPKLERWGRRGAPYPCEFHDNSDLDLRLNKSQDAFNSLGDTLRSKPSLSSLVRIAHMPALEYNTFRLWLPFSRLS
jgi:hypothetical protein